MEPEKVDKIVEGIWSDLTSRSGMDFDIDEETIKEIKESWRMIINENA